MNEDWYEEGRETVLGGISNRLAYSVGHDGDPDELAESIYSFLTELGLIDYDTEKDLFYEWFAGEED